jgi:hypothetical protein
MRFDPRLKFPAWVFVWLLSRGYMLAQVGLWDHVHGAEYQDVNTYEGWSSWIASTHLMPQEETWQYPPGAAFLFLIPRLGPLDFKLTFVIMMLAVDLIGFLLIAKLAGRDRRDTGVWIWLLVMPVLGSMPLLRFDLAATVIAIAALVVIHRRPTAFGALVGIGATIKVWPAFLLFAEWNRKRLLRAGIAAAIAVALVFIVAWAAFGEQSRFIDNQHDRGLQIESVGAAPWQLREMVTGHPMPIALRFGTSEIDSEAGEAMGTLLGVAAVLVLFAAAGWWWLRDRAIRRGRDDLADEVLARDFAFTVVLLFLVTSRVLSPQFMIWMVGLAAVVLCARTTRLARPAWLVLVATLLTTALGISPGRAVLRDLVLIAAAAEASWTMFQVVRNPNVDSEVVPGAAITSRAVA